MRRARAPAPIRTPASARQPRSPPHTGVWAPCVASRVRPVCRAGLQSRPLPVAVSLRLPQRLCSSGPAPARTANLLPYEPVRDLPAFELVVLRFETAEQIEEHRGQTCPPGLMAGAQPRSVVTLEELIEEDQVAPVRILLELGGATVDRPASVRAAQERARQPARDLLGHLEERHVVP